MMIRLYTEIATARPREVGYVLTVVEAALLWRMYH